MYQNKFVVAIKVNGKILRESSNQVTLPFGSEYTILLKNLNSVRALAEVSIDGKSATGGTKLIIEPNSSIEVERSIENGNFERGNRFKFIERTSEIEEHRGIGADDGLVRVEFWPEKVYRYPVQNYYPTPVWYNSWNSSLGGQHLNSGSLIKSSTISATAGAIGAAGVTRGLQAMNCVTQSFGDEQGITVPGSESNQKFVSGSWFATETKSEVIVLQLRGEVEGQPVQKPVTVKTNPKCITCGKSNKATANFCARCGTSLKLFAYN